MCMFLQFHQKGKEHFSNLVASLFPTCMCYHCVYGWQRKRILSSYIAAASLRVMIVKVDGETDGEEVEGELWHKGEIPNGNPGCFWKGTTVKAHLRPDWWFIFSYSGVHYAIASLPVDWATSINDNWCSRSGGQCIDGRQQATIFSARIRHIGGEDI